jgi:O-antigen/teichoic acid export membrane protein
MMNALSLFAVQRVMRTRLFVPSLCSAEDLWGMFHFGGWLFAGSILGMLVTPLNKIMLSRYAGVAALPVFEIAFTSSMKVRGLLDSGLRAMMPEMSRVSATLGAGAGDRARELMRTGLRLIAQVGIPIYVIAILFITPLLHLWLRSQFQETLPAALRLMLVGSFLNLLSVPGYYLLLGLGKARDSFIFGVIQTACSLSTLAISLLLTGSVTVMMTLLGMTIGMGVSTTYILWMVSQLPGTPRSRGLDRAPGPDVIPVPILPSDLPRII